MLFPQDLIIFSRMHGGQFEMAANHKKRWWDVQPERPIILHKQLQISPFIAPACKISGLKDGRTHLQTVYFPIYLQRHAF